MDPYDQFQLTKEGVVFTNSTDLTELHFNSELTQALSNCTTSCEFKNPLVIKYTQLEKNVLEFLERFDSESAIPLTSRIAEEEIKRLLYADFVRSSGLMYIVEDKDNQVNRTQLKLLSKTFKIYD